MRNKASFLLLVVFGIFLGMAIFHPFSHGVGHHDHDGHECPICMWLYYAAAISLFIIVFSVILQATRHIIYFPVLQVIRPLVPANISRAPPSL
jgi:hypothetical protein